MECERVREQIGAFLDSELASDEAAAVELHVARCPSCGEYLDAARQQHDELLQAFLPNRSVAARSLEWAIQALPTPLTFSRPWLGWMRMSLAAAAGFLLAVVIFLPWARPRSNAASEHAEIPVAVLGVATGPVTVQTPRGQVRSLGVRDVNITKGCRVLTGPTSRCELQIGGKATLRLDSASSLNLLSEDRLTLTQGRMWLKSGDHPLNLHTADFMVSCRQAVLELNVRPKEKSTLRILSGSVRIQDESLTQGQAVQLVDGRISRRFASGDPLLTTVWIHSILARKLKDDVELATRIRELWNACDAANEGSLQEMEIRLFGDRCVLPLYNFVNSAASKSDPPRRLKSARLMCELAAPESIPRLVHLLADDEGEIRFAAAVGLKRLTGKTFNLPPEQWRTADKATRESIHRKWNAWLHTRDWRPSRELSPVSGFRRLAAQFA